MTRYLLSCLLVMWVFVAQADERVYSEYEYDEIGNTKEVSQDLSGAAPSITSVTPAIVRQNQVVQVVIAGTGLRGAKLNNSDGFFSFSNTQTSNDQITLTLTVSLNATEGPSQVSVSTGLGTAFASFEILTELPDLRVSPIPVVIKTGSILNLGISLSKGDVVDHNVSLSIADTGVASPSLTSLNFAQGSIQPNQLLQLTAITAGRTRLSFESTTLGSYSFDLTVTNDEYPLVPGQQEIIYGDQVGLNKLFTPPPPDLIEIGPIINEVRINKLFADNASPLSTIAVAKQVGLLRGAIFDQLSPNAVGAGVSNQTITVSGTGLEVVDSVTVYPDTGTTLHDLVVDPSGQSLTFMLDVANEVELSTRQLKLSSTGVSVPAKKLLSDRFYIGGLLPVINSTTPIYLNRGDTKTITISGRNFEAIRSISFNNEDDLAFSNPVINALGTELTFRLQVIGFARLGPRVITLSSILGDSAPINTDASVIHIQDRPPEIITPVVSPAVGLVKEAEVLVQPSSETAYGNLVGVHRGALLTNLLPNSRAQGSSVTLALEGLGLDTVASVEFLPADGITVGDYVPAIDGLTATLQLDIAGDAEPSIRQIKMSDGVGLLKAQQGADRFEVTLPKPQIASITPVQIEQGATGIQLLVRGELLNNASVVSFIPADDILVSNVVASATGNEVAATINVAASAASGPRVVTVMTPGGITELASMVTNTVTIVQEITSTVSPVVSNAVGIVKEVTPVTESQERTVLSSGVGIVKELTIPTPQTDKFAVSKLVGVTRGPIAETITPSNVAINSTGQSIVVAGRHLDDVTLVRLLPPDGVTLNGPATIANDGSSISFTADVASDAAQTLRRLELETATDIIPFESLDGALIRITGLEPEISSIEPIQQVRGASFVMTVRGINFVDVQSIQATPSTGLTFGAATAAPDGRSVTVQVFISAAAATEQKVISVTTSAGATSSAAIPANTFTVISE